MLAGAPTSAGDDTRRLEQRLEGGVPVILGGVIVGAVGVSGMAASEDGVVTAAALRALEA